MGRQGGLRVRLEALGHSYLFQESFLLVQAHQVRWLKINL